MFLKNTRNPPIEDKAVGVKKTDILIDTERSEL